MIIFPEDFISLALAFSKILQTMTAGRPILDPSLISQATPAGINLKLVA
jgi:hypothetical protein